MYIIENTHRQSSGSSFKKKSNDLFLIFGVSKPTKKTVQIGITGFGPK